ncbi:MAG: cell division protein FtsA [Proteobacteria bacterium]|nr:cell division protein FtsA [Pseudomonadota bacterium]
MAKLRTGLIAALDIGTTKVCCLIAHAHGDGAIRIVGIGHHASRGLRGGAVIDMDAAQNTILTAISAAEELAGDRIRDVIINVSGGNLASQTYSAEIPVSGREINDSDLRQVLALGKAVEQPADRNLIHCIPIGYKIDATRGIREPRGMYANMLGVDMHIVSARTAALRNVATCVERCHLDIEAVVAAPYASGLACLVEDEIDLGVTIIDMGGGTTTIAVFYDGEVVHIDSIPVGGKHVTSDIARGLTTPLVHAERMKTLYGSTLPSPSDERELIDVPLIGEEQANHPNHVPRSLLNGIIRPRMEETFELVRSRLELANMDRFGGRRLVLTGGASQLQGVRELAALILEKQVRMGRPMRISGLPEATSGPAFSTGTGLLRYAVEKHSDSREHAESMPPGGPFDRIGQWLRENF